MSLPFSGVETTGGVMNVSILRNSTIPTKKAQVLTITQLANLVSKSLKKNVK